MDSGQIRKHILQLIGEAFEAKGKPAPHVDDDTLLIGGELDLNSLDLAGIVVGLSEFSAKDPFSEGFIEFRTLGELVKLYAD